jgi:glycosyltransferase involved in cell wall biosynthesis
LHVLTNSVPHTQSGYALRSHAVLRAQRDAGVDASAVTRLAYPVSVGRLRARELDVVDGVPYRRLLPPSLPRTLPERLQRQTHLVRGLVEVLRPDVLHATTDHTNGLVAEAVARAVGLPWVYEVRGLLEETWLARQPAALQAEAARSERYLLWKDREGASARTASHVVTLGKAMATELAARGVPEDRITVVPNGVDASLLDQALTPEEARARLGLPTAGFWVGTVSSLVAYEGLDTLLEAVALLRRGGLDARVLVVGDGVVRPALEHQARDLGLGSAAVFTGRVPSAAAPLHHQALDVFAVPRRDTPVCRLVTPLKPVEAMAVGRPVVASDLPALAEVVAEPASGRLARAEDPEAWAVALGELAGDDSARARFGAAGRSFAAGRTWQRAGQTYLELYTRLVEGA